jgi:hypothetical protein
MNALDCRHEAEVLAAVLEGRWPERAEPELREHSEQCAICAEVAAIAGALDADSEELRETVSVPDAGLVWWRAQLRARREAAKLAGRPITAAQVLGLASAAGIGGACFGATSQWFQAALRDFSTQPLLAEHWGIALGAGAVLLLLLPAAVFVAILRD